VKVFTKAEDIETNFLGKTSFAWREGWIDGTGVVQGTGRGILIVPGSKGRNQGMRLHGKFQLPSNYAFGGTISVRRTAGPVGPRRYTASVQADGNALVGCSVNAQARQERLATIRVLPTFVADSEFDLELIAIGDKLYSRCNGKALPVVTDTRLTEGELGIESNHLVRDIEVINLDGLSEAEALKAAGIAAVSSSPSPQVSPSPQFPPGQWVKAITKFEDIPAVARDKGLLKWREGWIEGTSPIGSPVVIIPGIRGRNQGIRLHGKVVAGAAETLVCNIGVRRMTISTEGKAIYRLTFAGAPTSAGLFYYDEQAAKNSGLAPKQSETPLKPGDEFDLELIVIGDKLYGKFNGKALPVVTDTRLTEGEMGFQTEHLVRDIEVINLDGLSEAEARKAAGVEGK
jgi:hypothetical protein